MQMRIEDGETSYVELEFPIIVPLSIEDEPNISLGPEVALRGISHDIIDYLTVINKPSINGIPLVGNRTNAELGMPTRTSQLINDSGFITDVNLIFDCGSATEVVYEE